MLDAITLDGFRCFAEPARVTFGALTVLAGANSAGKSSVIHALMALMQSEQQPIDGHLRLSGEWVEIGNFKQALNYGRQEARRFTLGITSRIGSDESDVLLTLDEPDESSAETARIERLEGCWNGKEISAAPGEGGAYAWKVRDEPSAPWKQTGVSSDLSPWSMPFSTPYWSMWARSIVQTYHSVLYLSAFRDLPRRFYPRRRSKLGPLLGPMGEYAAETLFARRNQMVDILPAPGAPRLLGAALEAWWSHIFGGDYGLRAESAEDLGYILSLDTPSAENLRLTQVGTGLSQALPVIVLALCSKPGDLVVIESPEVQLHPAAQHRLMDLFVALARAGRQVILETHSDHIIHAAQLAVKDKKLSPDDVAMRFFSMDEGAARVEPVPIDEHGRMQKQPIGFVDQATADLLELIR
jgi:predicted ATPase